MGMHQDMAQHKTLTQFDDVKQRNCVEIAYKSIYEKGYIVDSKVVEDLLQEQSLVQQYVNSLWYDEQ